MQVFWSLSKLYPLGQEHWALPLLLTQIWEQLYPVLHSSISTERIRRLFVTLDNSDKYVFRYYCKKNLKIPKKQSKRLHQRSTDYTMAKTSKKYRLYNGQDIEEVQTMQWPRHRSSTEYTMVKT